MSRILNNEIYAKVKIGKFSGVPRPLKYVYFLFFNCSLPVSGCLASSNIMLKNSVTVWKSFSIAGTALCCN
jgi:hypothetical protein